MSDRDLQSQPQIAKPGVTPERQDQREDRLPLDEVRAALLSANAVGGELCCDDEACTGQTAAPSARWLDRSRCEGCRSCGERRAHRTIDHVAWQARAVVLRPANDEIATPTLIAVAHGPAESGPEGHGLGGRSDVDLPIAVFGDELIDDRCADVGSVEAHIFPDLKVPDQQRC